ncbi:MAG: dihydrofolate reductase [Halobacteria archaeon]|nr:dihydrofolate reductase [Halobacteria archaeon]
MSDSGEIRKVIIVAMTDEGVIGKDGEIPWHYPEDMEHFRETTWGYPVLMGRVTYESLPDDYRPLPGRKNIVLTTDEGYEADETVDSLDENQNDEDVVENTSVDFVNSFEEAWEVASEASEKVFVAGGSAVYEQTIDGADRMVVTEVHESYDGDAAFPEYDGSEWREVRRDDRGEISFVEYLREPSDGKT